jgi:hypothetical protein
VLSPRNLGSGSVHSLEGSGRELAIAHEKRGQQVGASVEQASDSQGSPGAVWNQTVEGLAGLVEVTVAGPRNDAAPVHVFGGELILALILKVTGEGLVPNTKVGCGIREFKPIDHGIRTEANDYDQQQEEGRDLSPSPPHGGRIKGGVLGEGVGGALTSPSLR